MTGGTARSAAPELEPDVEAGKAGDQVECAAQRRDVGGDRADQRVFALSDSSAGSSCRLNRCCWNRRRTLAENSGVYLAVPVV